MDDQAEANAARSVVEAVRAAFPAEAQRVDARLAADLYDPDAHHSWLERFADLTNEAILRHDFDRAAAHLRVISSVLAAGDAATQRCLDVAYVESLMWNVKDEALKRKGWRLVPANLRKLYLGMWGPQAFMS